MDVTAPPCSLALPPASRITSLGGITEVGLGRRTQLHVTFFPGAPSHLTGAHGRGYTVPYGCDTSGYRLEATLG